MSDQLSFFFFFPLPISNASLGLCPKRNRAAEETLLFTCSQPSKAPSPQPAQLEVSSGRALGERARAQPGQRLLSGPQPLSSPLSRLPGGAVHSREQPLSVLQLAASGSVFRDRLCFHRSWRRPGFRAVRR